MANQQFGAQQQQQDWAQGFADQGQQYAQDARLWDESMGGRQQGFAEQQYADQRPFDEFGQVYGWTQPGMNRGFTGQQAGMDRAANADANRQAINAQQSGDMWSGLGALGSAFLGGGWF